MIYNRDEIINVFKTVQPMNAMNGSNVPMLSSADYRRGANLTCPKCGKIKLHVLTRVNHVWACNECNNTGILRRNYYRAANAYLIVNDLFSYFGENVSSDKMFNPEIVDGFLNFAEYKERPYVCILFMKLLDAILAKETSVLKIIPYMNKINKEMALASKTIPEIMPETQVEKSE